MVAIEKTASDNRRQDARRVDARARARRAIYSLSCLRVHVRTRTYSRTRRRRRQPTDVVVLRRSRATRAHIIGVQPEDAHARTQTRARQATCSPTSRCLSRLIVTLPEI